MKLYSFINFNGLINIDGMNIVVNFESRFGFGKNIGSLTISAKFE
jgi:hypothetical protein